MSDAALLVSTIVLVATLTGVVFVLLVQRYRSRVLSAHQLTWENASKRSQQIWKVQQEKRVAGVEQSANASMQHLQTTWKAWEAKDRSLIASTAQQTYTTLLHVRLEQEIARIPHTDEVPL